jgi:hypothetical protein
MLVIFELMYCGRVSFKASASAHSLFADADQNKQVGGAEFHVGHHVINSPDVNVADH